MPPPQRYIRKDHLLKLIVLQEAASEASFAALEVETLVNKHARGLNLWQINHAFNRVDKAKLHSEIAAHVLQDTI